jgi:hypothetical protein
LLDGNHYLKHTLKFSGLLRVKMLRTRINLVISVNSGSSFKIDSKTLKNFGSINFSYRELTCNADPVL